MHRQVAGLITFDQILRLLFRGVDRVSLECDSGGYFFLDRPPDPPCFRVPFHMIPDFERTRHQRDLRFLQRSPTLRRPRTSGWC